MGILIHTHELCKNYRVGQHQVPALRRVSLAVRQGEMVALMGPSGSGKSTFLHLVGCLDRPSSGSYWFEGVPVFDLSNDSLARIRRRHIGFIFQNFNLLPRLSALENVELPLRYSGVAGKQSRARGRAALERVGLDGRLHHRACTLSGGEQQRVAIARSLVNEPELILADEPTGSLDSRSGREILLLLKALNANGITVLLVTHDPKVADHAERLVRLQDGRVASNYRTRREKTAAET